MSLFDQDKSAERMPVSLITGFLGSGKTTLLNRVLGDPRMAQQVAAHAGQPITGFLGSGKTTLLNRVLGDPRMAAASCW